MNNKCKKVLASLMAVALTCGVLGTGSILKSNADEISDEKYKRANQIELDSNNELVITRNELGDTPMKDDESWTIFVYMCGSDLESGIGAATTDIKEMLAANYNENVNIIIQTGGSTEWKEFGIKQDEIGRYIVKEDELELVESVENSNMGAYKTLEDFVTWGVENYPAKRMGMIYWNHGGGSLYGACMDENFDDMLTLSEFELAMYNGTKNMTNKFDFIGFDACLMATLETANTFVPFADYMIASEEAESSEGWSYTEIVSALTSNTSIDAVELGKVIIDSFLASNIDNCTENTATLSMTDLSKIDDILVMFNKVAKQMDEMTKTKEDVTLFTRLAHIAENYSEGCGYDLIDFTDYMLNIEELIPEAKEVASLMENAIVYEKHGEIFKDTKGLSFYYCYGNINMGQMNILRNITVSPYLLNFIEKIAYGSSHDGSLEGYASNAWDKNMDYYYDNNYDFVEYEFEEDLDYSEVLSNSDYFGAVTFDEVWYGWFVGNSYYEEENIDWEEQLGSELVIDGESLDNTLSENDLEEVAKANYKLVVDNGDSMSVIGDLGSIEEGATFNGTWFALSNGSLLAASKVNEGNSLTMYKTKILLDGEENFCLFVADKRNNVRILSTYTGMDEETKSAGRVNAGIKEGVSITPIYEAIDYQTGKVTKTFGDTTTSNKNIISATKLEEGSFALEMTDAFGMKTYSKPIR